MSMYMVYEQVVSGVGMGLEITMQRHFDLMNRESEFYNPWQYRVFSTYLLQAMIFLFDQLNELLPLHNILGKMHQYIPLIMIRFLQNVFILWIALIYYRSSGIQSFFLLITGLIFLGLTASNANFASDLSVNTFFDVLFYLLAGNIIISHWSNRWLVPLTFIAALNRETSAFIPLMLIIYHLDTNNKSINQAKAVLTIASLCIIIFLIVYISTRLIFGVPGYHGINNLSSPTDFFVFNISFGSLYPELFGTLLILPLLVLLYFKKLSVFHQKLFLLIVPVWFLIHFFQSQAMETRLFLVPHALIFIPAFLLLIENELKSTYLKLK